MLDLSGNGLRMIEALFKASIAWQSPVELASAMDLGLEETTDLVAMLDAGGWLSSWVREFDVVVTLSVAGASRMGFRLVEVGRDEIPRWAGSGDPEPPIPRALGVFRGERAAKLELVVDSSISAEEAVARAEESLMRLVIPSDPRDRAFLGRLPSPTILVGTGLSPWPGPLQQDSGLGTQDSGLAVRSSRGCPSCGSKRLKPSMYCLYCDRWGLDHLLVDNQPPRVRVCRDPRDDARRQDHDRQLRKDKRKSRRGVQIDAERRLKRPAGAPGRSLKVVEASGLPLTDQGRNSRLSVDSSPNLSRISGPLVYGETSR